MNMPFEPEFLEKSGKMEFQDHYQPCANYCLIPSVSGSFLCVIIASKASNTAWRPEIKCADVSLWDNHCVVAALSNFWTFLPSACWVCWASIMLEWFHQFHEVLYTLVIDVQSWMLSDGFCSSYILSEELDVAFSFGAQIEKNKQWAKSLLNNYWVT